MAGIRFASNYFSVDGTLWRIDIWDSAHSGDVTLFETDAGGAKIRYSPEGRDRHSPIATSECSFTFYIEDETHEALIEDLAASVESRFWVGVYKAGLLQWAGVILTDTIRYEDMYYPYAFEITATDGIASLKDTQYDNAGTRYTGAESMKWHVLNILSKLPFLTIWEASDKFLRTSIDWWDGNGPATPGPSDDPFSIYWAQHETFYKFEKGEARVMSCYDVLSAIMTAWGARIYLVDGVFWAEQIGIRSASSFYAHNYNKAGTLLSTDNATGDNTIDQSSANKITGLQYEFFPPLARTEITYNVFNRRNFLSGWNGTNAIPQKNVKIQDNAGVTTLHISFDISLNLTNDTYTVAQSNYLALLFSIELDVGTTSLNRAASVSNFTVTYQNAEWQTDTGAQVVTFLFPVIVPVVGETNSYTIPFEIVTPPLTASGAWDFGITFDGGYDQNGVLVDTSNFTWDLGVAHPYMEVFSYGQPAVAEDNILYKAYNPNAGNTAVIETEILIGDADNPNTVGRLQYGTSSASLVDTTSWNSGTASRTLNFGDLLARTIQNGQIVPIRKMLGQIRGDFLLWRRWWQELDGTYWLTLGGTWITGQDTFDGECFFINYGSSATSVTPVKRRVNIFPTTSLPTTPSTNNGPGLTTQAAANVEGLVIKPVVNNTALSDIPAGATTTININEALVGDYNYQVGEAVLIYSPIDGSFEEVEISGDSSDGDTFISVTGTLSNSYPSGAYIIKKNVVGVTTLPGGPYGSILYKGTSAWTILPHGDAGYVLTTNGPSDPPTWEVSGDGNGIYSGSGTVPSGVSALITDSFRIRYPSGNGALAINHFGALDAKILGDGGSGFFQASDTKAYMQFANAGGASLEINDTQTLFTDYRTTKKGIEYAADYSANYSNRSLVDKGYITSAISGAVPSGTDKQTLRYNGTALTANSALQNDGTYIGVNGIPSSSYMIRVKQSTSTKGVFVERDSDATGVHIYHDGSGTIHSTGGYNIRIKSDSGSIIDMVPGGGSGQIRQVSIAPGASVTSVENNASLLGVNATFAPTASGGDFSVFNAEATINQTGSANGVTRGLKISPTFTGVANTFRGVEYVPSTQNFLWQASGTSVTSHLIGNVGIGTGTTSPGAKIDIVGNGTTSGTYGLKVYDGAGTPAVVLVIRDDKRIGVLTTSPAVTLDAATATDSIALPTGTTAQRPSVNSSARINSTVGGLEIRNGGAWNRITCTTTPTIAAGAAAGSGPSVSINSGNDLCHEVQVDVGTSPTTGVLCTVTFNQALDATLFTYPVFCARNAGACSEITKFYIYNAGNSSYQIYANAAPTASTTFIFNVIVKQ